MFSHVLPKLVLLNNVGFPLNQINLNREKLIIHSNITALDNYLYDFSIFGKEKY